MGANPSTVYWMDIYLHIFVVKIVMFAWKTEINVKEAGMAHFFKKMLPHFGSQDGVKSALTK